MTKHTHPVSFRHGLIVSLLLLSCAPELDNGGDEVPATTDLDTLVPVTIARMGDQGQIDAHVEWMTVREQEAMKREREQWSQRSGSTGRIDLSSVAITSQGGCGPALWLWDAPGQTGRQLCLTRSGGGALEVDSLNNWIRGFSREGGPLYWSRAVRSVWAGIDTAYLRRGASFYEADSLLAGQRVDNVGSTIANAIVVGMNSTASANQAQMTIRTTYTHNTNCPKSFRVFVRAVDNSQSIDTTCNLIRETPSHGCQCDALIPLRYGEYYSVQSFPPAGPTRPCSMNVHDVGLFISRDPNSSPDTYEGPSNSRLLDLDLCLPF